VSLGGNSTSLTSLVPSLQHSLKSLLSPPSLQKCGVQRWRVTSARRSRAAQAQLYRSFLAGRSSFTALPPGLSKHEYGLACDIVTEPYGALWCLGATWKKAGGLWSPEDPIHFEFR
jgi:hypothetical protein